MAGPTTSDYMRAASAFRPATAYAAGKLAAIEQKRKTLENERMEMQNEAYPDQAAANLEATQANTAAVEATNANRMTPEQAAEMNAAAVKRAQVEMTKEQFTTYTQVATQYARDVVAAVDAGNDPNELIPQYEPVLGNLWKGHQAQESFTPEDIKEARAAIAAETANTKGVQARADLSQSQANMYRDAATAGPVSGRPIPGETNWESATRTMQEAQRVLDAGGTLTPSQQIAYQAAYDKLNPPRIIRDGAGNSYDYRSSRPVFPRGETEPTTLKPVLKAKLSPAKQAGIKSERDKASQSIKDIDTAITLALSGSAVTGLPGVYTRAKETVAGWSAGDARVVQPAKDFSHAIKRLQAGQWREFTGGGQLSKNDYMFLDNIFSGLSWDDDPQSTARNLLAARAVIEQGLIRNTESLGEELEVFIRTEHIQEQMGITEKLVAPTSLPPGVIQYGDKYYRQIDGQWYETDAAGN